MIATKELSIFVDESGDFGPYARHSPFYIFTLVFHDQSQNILPEIERLEEHLRNIGMPPAHCFHAGPIVRREEDYAFMTLPDRRKLLGRIMAFARSTHISYISFSVQKKQAADSVALIISLSKKLSRFIQANYPFFHSFDRIVVYYDNGQVELNKILATVFSVLLPNTEFKRVIPAQYRLFQVADLICTIELLELKADAHILSKSEEAFFGASRDMKKNYMKPIHRLRFGER